MNEEVWQMIQVCWHQNPDVRPRIEMVYMALIQLDRPRRAKPNFEIRQLKEELASLTSSPSKSSKVPSHTNKSSTSKDISLYHHGLVDKVLDQIIKRERMNMSSYPHDHPDLLVSCQNLASSLRTRYNNKKEDAVLQELIRVERKALKLCVYGHPESGTTAANLVNSLKLRFKLDGQRSISDIRDIIYLEFMALRLYSRGSEPTRARILRQLAQSLQFAFKIPGHGHWCLEQAIKLEFMALSATTSDHPNRKQLLGHYTSALKLFYIGFQDDRLLEELVKVIMAALDATPANHPSRPRLSNCLHATLRMRYKFQDIPGATLYRP
jgi:hypothetical protein